MSPSPLTLYRSVDGALLPSAEEFGDYIGRLPGPLQNTFRALIDNVTASRENVEQARDLHEQALDSLREQPTRQGRQESETSLHNLRRAVSSMRKVGSSWGWRCRACNLPQPRQV
jgi:hypothetical protein